MQGLSVEEAADLELGLKQSAEGQTSSLGSFAQYVEPTSWHKAILRGLQGRKVYEGTVPFSTVTKRRSKNKAARKARRLNRH